MSEARRIIDVDERFGVDEEISLQEADQDTFRIAGRLALVEDIDEPIIPAEIETLRQIQSRRRFPERGPSNSEEPDLIKLFKQDIGSIPLIDKDEERCLSMLNKGGRRAQAELEADKDTLQLSAAERAELEEAVKIGEEARTAFIEANYRLLVHWAKFYRDKGVALLDLVQDAYPALERAVDEFDESMGFKFSTYATWKIRQEMQSSIYRNRFTVRQPRHRGELVDNFERAQALLALEFGPLEEEEVAEIIGWPKKQLSKMREVRRGQNEVSLNMPVGGDENIELGDFFTDETAQAGFESAENKLLSDEIKNILANFSEREREVLTLRYGLDGHEPLTLKAVGEHLGLSMSSVRQIESRVFSKLRHPVYIGRLSSLRDFLN